MRKVQKTPCCLIHTKTLRLISELKLFWVNDDTVSHRHFISTTWSLKSCCRAKTIQQSLLPFYLFTPLHRCCSPVKTLLMESDCRTRTDFPNHCPHVSPSPSLYLPLPPPTTTPRPVANIKRWCIQQSMVVTLLCCYPSFQRGPQCDLVRLLRHNWGRGVHLYLSMYVSFLYCVFSMFRMQDMGN